MWCYQKPGFEALMLAELQRQQQCSQFCDTLLKADGVSVPAHSCILSAISPHISSSLSSTPVPEAGQRHLLEFRALRACTLLHMVRLLYSGEMVGEGEKEKQEAISAAAKLGINGLVEVTHNDKHHRKVREGCFYTEVGVQTDSQIPVDNGVRLGGWRREVQDGTTLLWRETLPTQGTETCTQTEDLHMSQSSSQSAVSYETIDMNALQSLGQAEALQIPYVPMSVVYSNEDNQRSGQFSGSAVTPPPTVHFSSLQPNVFPIASQTTPCAVDTQSWGRCHEIGRAAVMEEWPEDGFEQFEGNIPGFINYFLNPEKEECSNRRRGRRRQGAGVGGVRQAGETGGRGRGRGRRGGGLTQTVDVQNVGVSKLAKSFQHRWSLSVKRTGQGGGAVGRKLVVKTREFIRSGRGNQRRGRGAEWDIEHCANILVKTEAGTSAKRGRRKVTPHQDSPCVPRVHRVLRPKVTARLPEEQPEQIDRLLEEVMMGLDILPNNSKKTQVKGSTAVTTTTNSCEQGRQQSQHHGPQFQGSPQVVPIATQGKESSDVPILQQQNEGEFTDILDQFLQSFEQLESAAAQNYSQPHTRVNEYRKNNTQVTLHTAHQQRSPCLTPAQRGPRPRKVSHSETSETDSPVVPSQASAQKEPPKNSTVKSSSPATRRVCKRRNRDYLFSLEKPRVKTKKATTSTKALKKEEVVQRVNRQLQQMPVVKLERRGVLPYNIRLQELSQSPVQRSSGSPSAKACSCTSLWGTKIYPIRSRFREAQIMDSIAFLEEPLSNKPSKGRPRKNGLLPSFPAQNILRQPPQSSLSTVEEQMENNEEVSDHGAADRRGRKRALGSEEDTGSDAVEIKRICLDPDAAPEFTQCSPEDGEEVIDVETVSLNSTENTVLKDYSEIRVEKVLDLTMEEGSTDTESDEIIDVEEYCLESTRLKKDDIVHAEVICTSTIITVSPIEDIEDDIDVIGASCPIPSPVFIDWTDTSESEEEDPDIDVQEEETAYMPSVTLSKGELVRC